MKIWDNHFNEWVEPLNINEYSSKKEIQEIVYKNLCKIIKNEKIEEIIKLNIESENYEFCNFLKQEIDNRNLKH